MAANPASNDIAGGSARRLNIGGMPSPPTVLLFAALVLVTAVEAASLYTIAVLRDALLQGGLAGWLVIWPLRASGPGVRPDCAAPDPGFHAMAGCSPRCRAQ